MVRYCSLCFMLELSSKDYSRGFNRVKGSQLWNGEGTLEEFSFVFLYFDS